MTDQKWFDYYREHGGLIEVRGMFPSNWLSTLGAIQHFLAYEADLIYNHPEKGWLMYKMPPCSGTRRTRVREVTRSVHVHAFALVA